MQSVSDDDVRKRLLDTHSLTYSDVLVKLGSLCK